MQITLNNSIDRLETKKDSISVKELLEIKNFTFELLIVRINGELVKKDFYTTSLIKESDKVDVIHVFGGG